MATILEISALNRYVQSLLQEDSFLQDIALRGEIGNFNRHHKTGHCYFTLSDAKASIKAVLFRTQADRLSFSPKNGMRVVARGRVSLYERDGAYQLYVDVLFEEGLGAQKMALDLLKEKLFKEGLFDESCKKNLPPLAFTVGIITSKSGAALQDILQVAQRRNPCARVFLSAVAVQGNEAATDVRLALQKMDACALDIIIIARGGGSAEDLAAFNDDALARAVFHAKTPIISAIGHEIDFTILDFVADKRAPTPSAAAELAFPNMAEHLQKEELKCKNQGKNIHNYLHLCYNEINTFQKSLAVQAPSRKLLAKKTKLQQISFELQQKLHDTLAKHELEFRESAQLAAGLNPYFALKRGYVMAEKHGKTLSGMSKLQCGDLIDLRFSDGHVQALVQEIHPQQEVVSHE